MDSPQQIIATTHLPNGIVQFPPNVHGIYIEHQQNGRKRLVLRQNDVRLSFVLDGAACRHLAALLTA